MSKTRKKSRSRVIALPRAVKRLFPQVARAYDSDDYIAVHVNKKDCDDAVSGNPAECAVARAVRREFKADGAIIGVSASYVIKGKVAIRYETPDHVRRELVSFDRHHDFEPGEYALRPTRPSQRLGVARSRHARSNPDKVVRRKVFKTARVRQLEGGVSFE